MPQCSVNKKRLRDLEVAVSCSCRALILRVSEMTQMLRPRIATGTAPNTLSSVTNDQIDQTDAIPPSVSCGRTAHSPSAGKYVQKYAWAECRTSDSVVSRLQGLEIRA